jgi:hypothetical protein
MIDKTYFFVTIDTENFTQAPDPIKKWPEGAWGKIKNKAYGFPEISNICNKHGTKATFFVNVFEYKRLGKKYLENICQEIKKSGHDVQLHTHPAWLWEFPFMKNFSYGEQVEIIGHGKELLKMWTGEECVAHRAGYYGANVDTLKALKANGIYIDSSGFFGHLNSDLNITKNQPVIEDGVIEIPINYFFNKKTFQIAHWCYCRTNKIKFDIDAATLSDLKCFVLKGIESGLRVFNLSMHSFSFLRVKKGYKGFIEDKKEIKKFDDFLYFLNNLENVEFITMKKLNKLRKLQNIQVQLREPDIIVESNLNPVKIFKNKFDSYRFEPF